MVLKLWHNFIKETFAKISLNADSNKGGGVIFQFSGNMTINLSKALPMVKKNLSIEYSRGRVAFLPKLRPLIMT